MRAIVVHGSMDSPGGCEAYCLRVVEILQRRFEEVLVLHSGRPLNLDEAERWFNVSFDRNRVRFEAVAPGPLGRMLEWFSPGRSFSQLKSALFCRRLERRVADADLLATTKIECTLHGRRIIQSIHYPQYGCDLESLGYLGWSSPSRLRHWLKIAYVKLGRLAAGWDPKHIGSLLTITNSYWTAEQFRRLYPARDVRAIHSGVDLLFSPASDEWIPFDKRENNFVILGHIMQQKRTHLAVEIISRLRDAGHDVGLHIIGRRYGDYADALQRATVDKPWIHWHSALDRKELESLIIRQKWGLHCFENEHYGKAVAELQGLGCITFIHDSGGQREIILNPAHRYTDAEDAVRKIDAVLRAPETHARLVAEQLESNKRHTIEAFRDGFLAVVDEIMRPGDKK